MINSHFKHIANLFIVIQNNFMRLILNLFVYIYRNQEYLNRFEVLITSNLSLKDAKIDFNVFFNTNFDSLLITAPLMMRSIATTTQHELG